MICNLYRSLLLSLFVLLGTSPLLAQSTSDQFGSELSGHIGTLLPNQIPGVTEVLPAWGIRYALPLSGVKLEGGYRNTHAKGVDFQVMSLDLRFDMNTVPGFTNVFYVGYDMNAYQPLGESQRTWKGGAHLGTGLMMHVASSFWLRGDLSFAVQPGTSLYLGFGIAIRWPGGN